MPKTLTNAEASGPESHNLSVFLKISRLTTKIVASGEQGDGESSGRSGFELLGPDRDQDLSARVDDTINGHIDEEAGDDDDPSVATWKRH